jgi:hypothetical protein
MASARPPQVWGMLLLMSISGNLRDMPVSEVMQFVHLGSRSGTLELNRGAEQATIVFRSGKLIGARSPKSRRIGDLLLVQGLVGRTELEVAVALQQREEPRRSIGQILLAQGVIELEDLRRVVRQQIEQAVAEVLLWDSGVFEFLPDDIRPIDDIVVAPRDVLPVAELNTHMVLVEAARIFDERGGVASTAGDGAGGYGSGSAGTRARSAKVAAPPSSSLLLLSAQEIEEALSTPAGLASLSPVEHLELHIVTADEGLAHDVDEPLRSCFARVVRCGLNRAGDVPLGAPPPVVLVDMRKGGAGLDSVAALRALRPRISLLCVADETISIGQAYEAGATGVVTPVLTEIVDGVGNLLRARRDLGQLSGAAAEGGGAERIRRVISDLRPGTMSAGMALSFMQIVSEAVERAVLFLVKADRVTVLGAFGLGREGQHLAVALRGVEISLEADHVLARAVRACEVQSAVFENAELPRELREALGPPRNGHLLVFPISGAQRVIALVYADNGIREEYIRDIDILELATTQVGVGFENELLRRHIDKG